MASYDPQSALTDFNNSPFFDFLRDVLYEQPFDPAKVAAPQGLPVLDICDNANMELTDMDFGLLHHWNLDGMGEGTVPIRDATSRHENSAEISQMRKSLVKVWSDSPWRWQPNQHDSAFREQPYFAVSAHDASSAQLQGGSERWERVITEKLGQAGRDRVLAILLTTCRETAMANRVASSFPSTDVMDTLVHIFLALHACQVDGWIHFATFKLSEQWPEWIAMAAAMGAASGSVPTLRKFGFAVLESVRTTLPIRVSTALSYERHRKADAVLV